MAKAKTATLSFRIKPTLKDALRAAAAREPRGVANMVLDYCGRKRKPAPRLLRHSDHAVQFKSRNHDALEEYVANKWPLFRTEYFQ